MSAPGTITLAALLFVLIGAIAFRGGVASRAIGPGLLGGVWPFAVPWLLRFVGQPCCGSGECGLASSSLCLPACVGGGVLAGVVVAFLIAREPRPRLALAGWASAIAILTGSLGCLFAGASGLVGMLLGTLVTSAPVAIVGARRV
jgi:hypothetical protein